MRIVSPLPRAPRIVAAALALLCLAAQPAAGDRHPFAPPGTPPSYMPARGYDLLDRHLTLAFDWDDRSVAGTAVNRLSPLLADTRTITLHAAQLDISEVRVDGQAARWTADPAAGSIRVELPRPVGPEDTLEVAVDYSARPTIGLYFVGPDAAYPDKPKQIWSQGESEFNRYWFPSWDYPNDRATTEIDATVERPFQVVSNGRLTGVDELADGRRTYHWVMDQPHTTYLVSVVVGELTRVADSWNGTPIEYYVPPGHEEEARRSFGKTPQMVDFYSTVTGQPYPYPKYAQTTAVDFIWGGMENISATTQTIATLHPAATEPDVSSDGLVAHELAHQWFGDLLTTRSWAHAWLNEAFATYFTGLWREHAEGADAFAWEAHGWREAYFREDRERYRRPIVTHVYPAPMEMFDRHLYQKGALVLDMVRGLTGDAGWWQGIRHYVDQHKWQTVTTADFTESIEEATGVSLGALFDQFVYGAGHPRLEVSWHWLPERALVRLDVEQTQELDEQTGLFSYPVTIGVAEADGGWRTSRLPLEARARQSLYLPAAARPRTVVFDPAGVFLAQVDFAKPTGEWIVQLDAVDALAGKLEAIRQLGERGGAAAVTALAGVLASHPFHGARSETAKALGKIGTPAALAALAPAFDDADSRVRGAALEALGDFPGGVPPATEGEVVARLRRALGGEASVHARAAAARALGHFHERKGEVAPWLVQALGQDSYRQVVREAALEALTSLHAESGWEPARRLARYGAPTESREQAMKTLAILARGDERRTAEALDLLSRWARSDPGFTAREAAYDALAELGDEGGLPVLREIARSELDPQQRRAAVAAARDLADRLSDNRDLRQRVKELERETESLRRKLSVVKDEGGSEI